MVNLLHEVGHDLVVHVVIDVQVHLRVVKMVPNAAPVAGILPRWLLGENLTDVPIPHAVDGVLIVVVVVAVHPHDYVSVCQAKYQLMQSRLKPGHFLSILLV